MAALDASGRQRESLPSILNFDFEQYKLDKTDHKRYSMPGFSTLSRPPMSSPPSTYSGPPPPYSSAVSVSSTAHGIPDYASSPQISSRRSTRDDKEPLPGLPSLPSISEALKSAEAVPQVQQYVAKPAPRSGHIQSFTDAPKGPGNPFSQPGAPASALRPTFSAISEPVSIKTVPPPPTTSEVRQQPPTLHAVESPRLSQTDSRFPVPPVLGPSPLDSPFKSSFPTDPVRPGYPFPDFPTPSTVASPHPSSTFNFEQQSKKDDSRNPFAKPDALPYNETVKRHLDIYDAEVALNEIHDASQQTLEFSKAWSQRYHQANRTSYFNDGLPGTSEIDDMIRYSHHIIEGLTKLRDVAVMQQNAINEQRARVARGTHADEDYQRISEEYKAGGFAGGDAKKRRGKAAPPGRCHSCNRAETPEWRRGPDGARTLCNACGLHYAKLTRKMGANKAAVMTGSNLRPKSLTDTHP